MAERPEPLFGSNVDPSANDPQRPFRWAAAAERGGLDLITLQDHPYNARFLDTWTLLAALAMRTERIHLGTNVTNLPLRPPAMLAKQAATLDLLSGGRLEMGLGAGAFWEGIRAWGGPERDPAEAYRAFEEALQILQLIWSDQRAVSFQGEFYQVRGAHPGPRPAHPIRIWVGATGPRMLRLVGREADGILLSTSYVWPDDLPAKMALIDEGAAQAGRSPTAIRRGYNLMGVIVLGRPETPKIEARPGLLVGPPAYWVDEIERYYRELGQDTFIVWPVAGDEIVQVEAFANDVVPAVRERLGT